MHRVSIVYKSRHFYHLLKTQNLIALFISPDDYDITVNWKENANFLMFSMFLHFTEAATSICLLKKVFTTRRQKALDFFQRPWLLIIINFIDEQLFAEHRFLKNTFAWLLLNLIHVLLPQSSQKGFSQLFFAWPVKWWVSLKLWNNHSRDWINNFPFKHLWLLGILFNKLY